MLQWADVKLLSHFSKEANIVLRKTIASRWMSCFLDFEEIVLTVFFSFVIRKPNSKLHVITKTVINLNTLIHKLCIVLS